MLQPAAVEVDLQAEQGPDGAGGRLRVIEPGLHRHDSLNCAAVPKLLPEWYGGYVERATRGTCHGATSMPKNDRALRFDLG